MTGESSNGYIITNTNSEKIKINFSKKCLGPSGKKSNHSTDSRWQIYSLEDRLNKPGKLVGVF